MRVPSHDLRKSLRTWRECQTVRSGVDRMWALQRFRSAEPRDCVCKAGTQPTWGVTSCSGNGIPCQSDLSIREWLTGRQLHPGLEGASVPRNAWRSSRRMPGRRKASTSPSKVMNNLQTWRAIPPVASCSLFPKRCPLPIGLRECPEIGSVLPSGHHKLASRFCRTPSPPLSHKAVKHLCGPGNASDVWFSDCSQYGRNSSPRIGGPIWQPLSRRRT